MQDVAYFYIQLKVSALFNASIDAWITSSKTSSEDLSLIVFSPQRRHGPTRIARSLTSWNQSSVSVETQSPCLAQADLNYISHSLSSSSSSATKKSILSSEHESPWTSNVLPSSIHLIFPTPITEATHIALTFQGGFVCTSAMIYVATKSRDKESLVDLGLMMGGKLYPEDRNRRQIFE